MFTNLSKIPIKLGILLVGVGLLVAGCDSAGTNNGQNNQDEAKETIAFEAADWSNDRINHFDGNGSADAKAAVQKSVPSFEYNSQAVPPPNISNTGQVAASHLAVSTTSNNNTVLYVGYKNVGGSYGGGIDILKDDGTLNEASGSGTNALEEPEVDVQELAVKESGGNPNVLYAATAVDPDATVSQSPQFHSINLNSDGTSPTPVEFDAFDLDEAGNDGSGPADVAAVAKSVTVLDGLGVDVFVASDSSFGYTINTTSGNNDYDIDGTFFDDESGINQLRNVVQAPSNGLYALDFSGDVWEWSGGAWNTEVADLSGDLSNPGTSPGGPGGGSDAERSIARLTSHDFTSTNQGYGFKNDDLLFAALNGAGFKVYSEDTPSDVRYSSRDDAGNDDTVPEIYASSVEVTDNFVYVASGTTIAIYEIKSGLANADRDEGLEYLGQQEFENDGQFGFAAGAQINDIHVVPAGNLNGDGNILYVAKSTDGVVKLTQKSGGPYNN